MSVASNLEYVIEMEERDTGNDLRELLRRYPTGVTVVTSTLKGKPWGGTMNSFTSVSLNPPLVALFITTDSRTSAAINETGKFVINILKEDQEVFARTFADDGNDDKFSGLRYHFTDEGVPVLDDSLGFMECSLYLKEEIADHFLFVGEVHGASILNDSHALIYHRRGFKSTSALG